MCITVCVLLVLTLTFSLVPVFDGRADLSRNMRGFRWRPADFQSLGSFPRYEGEIATESLVTVGYSVSTWTREGTLCVSFWALFVIVLSNPL